MSDQVQKAFEVLIGKLIHHESAAFHRALEVVAVREALQSGEPVALERVEAYIQMEYDAPSHIVIEPDPEGSLVYYDNVVRVMQATPQPVVDVNQKLVKALKEAESHLVAMMAYIEHKPQRFQEHCWQQVLDIREALLSAGKGGE
jgi:hypothetical protein